MYGYLTTALTAAVTKHGVDQDLRRRMFEQTRAFFDLPVEDKENVKVR